MESTKKAFISGKLNGTHTYKNDLKSIENPDEIERFLLDFYEFKLSKDLLVISNISTISGSESFLNEIEKIKKYKAIGIYIPSNFEKIYIAAEKDINYSIDVTGLLPALIGKLTSLDGISKYIINSFTLLKWLGDNSLEAKQVFDIPTYIKLLTNDVDPYKKAKEYLSKYSDFEDNNSDEEKNNMILARFSLNFGQYLAEKTAEFNLQNVSIQINENAEFEAIKWPILSKEECASTIVFKYINMENALENKAKQSIDNSQKKAYILTSLGRIIPKYNWKMDETVKNALFEDLTIKILGNLYSNNIPVRYEIEKNEYIISCKQKNIGNIFNITQAIFIDSFDSIFSQSPEISIKCHIR